MTRQSTPLNQGEEPSQRRATAARARMGPGTGALLLVGMGLVLGVLLLATVEFVAGFFVGGPQQQETALSNEGDSVARTLAYLEINPAPMVPDVDVLWRNEPGAHRTQPVNPRAFGREDTWTVENNSEGFRGPERPTASDEHKVFRILCVGDSITFGFSVDQPDTYPRQLLELLEKRYPGRPFEVVNTGVPGWTWVQGLKFLKSRGLAMHPDLVIIGHGTNDQLFSAKVTDEERLRALENPVNGSFQKFALYLSRTNTYRALALRRQPPPTDEDSPGCQEQVHRFGSCKRVSVDQISAAVHEVSRITAEAGVDLLVVNTDFVETAAVQGVSAAAEHDGIAFLNLVEELNARKHADEDGRAERLGLAKASTLAAATDRAVRADAKRVLLRVLVSDPTRTYRVEGQPYFQPGGTFRQPVNDDGTHGDERAGDGVFSAMLEVPTGIGAIEYKFYQGDVAEFTSLPPLASKLGDRLLRTPGSLIAPVDVFGQALYMVERAHPNRDGHQVIAQFIADKIEDFAWFRAYVHAAPVPAMVH